MPEHRSSSGKDDSRPFVTAVQQAFKHDTTVQVGDDVPIKTWLDVRSPDQPLNPALLGALALVVDHLGDAYLLDPIEAWIREPDSRTRTLSFL
jgi:hypothetical protein